jgi:hypothetical protein
LESDCQGFVELILIPASLLFMANFDNLKISLNGKEEEHAPHP